MNKSDLVQALSTKSDLSKAQALKAIEALFSTDDGLIIDALKRGEKVQISGFGTFETKQRNIVRAPAQRGIDACPGQASYRGGCRELADEYTPVKTGQQKPAGL